MLGAPPRRPDRRRPPADTELPPLVISARTEASLRELARTLARRLAAAAPEEVGPLLRSAARRRDHHPQRLVALGADRAETVAALADFAAGADNPAVSTGTALRDGKLAFVFAGNGAQWPGMGRDAYQASAAFRDAVGRGRRGACARRSAGRSASCRSAAPTPRNWRMPISRSRCSSRCRSASSRCCAGSGSRRPAHIGHSVGEIGAAWAAGALSLEEAARVVVARSRQQERTRGRGRMAALALGADAARELLAEIGSPLELGAMNARQSVTISGPEDAIERLGAEARRRGLAFRPLDLDFAFHSAAMDPIRDDLLAESRRADLGTRRDTC